MRQKLLMLALLAALAVPMIASADDQGWMPPEWTPTPPARPSVDLVQTPPQALVSPGGPRRRPAKPGPYSPEHGRNQTDAS